jgi:membrane-associated phospholipid phosphatase
VLQLAARRSARLWLDRRATTALLVALGVFLVASASLAHIADDVSERNGVTRSDPGLLRYFVVHRTSAWIDAARALSQVGSIGVLVALGVVAAGGMWWRRVPLALAVAPLISLVIGAGFASIGKSVFDRPRPPLATRLVTETEPSFPSGHATDSTSLFVALGLVVAIVIIRRLAVQIAVVAGFCLLAAAIGISRLELGVHWPSDVVAGGALGLAVALAVVCSAALAVRLGTTTRKPLAFLATCRA